MATRERTIEVMHGAKRSKQSFSSHLGIGSVAHCLSGVVRINCNMSSISNFWNDWKTVSELLSLNDAAGAPSVTALIPLIFFFAKNSANSRR